MVVQAVAEEGAILGLAGVIWMKGRLVLAVLFVVLAAACTWALTRSSATVPVMRTAILRVDTNRPGNEFAPGAVGLSMEAGELSTGDLTAAHYRLVRLMRLLGPSVLRIGGDSVDLSWWTSSGERRPSWATSIITPADLSTLHGLLTATGWRVLLGVDLGHFEPARAANEARYARKILGVDLLGIEIGNEPNGYAFEPDNLRSSTYGIDAYLREAEVYRQALSAAVPGVAIYGPALTQSNAWLISMGTSARMFTEITQHYYAINKCPETPPSYVQSIIVELLSPAVRQREENILQTLALVGRIAGRATRIGETNSVACRPTIDASPAFAGALWSLDWTLRAVSSGVQGLNFHGDPYLCAAYPESPICAPGDKEAVDAGDVTAQPGFYGLLAARQLEGGRFVPTSLVAPDPLPNLTTWATLTPSGTIRIAIDNLATGGLAQPVSISVAGYMATEEKLIAPSVSASSDISLGGAAVTSAGKWRPKPTRLLHVRSPLRVVVPPASALIVTLFQERPGGRHCTGSRRLCVQRDRPNGS